MARIEYAEPPHVSLWATALKRGRKGPIPHIEAHAARLGAPLAAYQAVCGLPDTGTLPVAFPDLLCRGLQLAVLTHAEFPLGLLGIVHVRQQIDQHRAIAADEPLSGRVWVEGHRPARRGGEFDMTTEVSAGGQVVWSGITTILSRELPGDGVKREHPPEPTFAAARSAAWDLPEDLGRRYAKVSGDINPIHQYAWTAKMFGFPRAIIHGWWTLARATAELDLAPGPTRLDVAFHAPILLPNTVWFGSGPADGGTAFTVRTKDKLAVSGRVSP